MHRCARIGKGTVWSHFGDINVGICKDRKIYIISVLSMQEYARIGKCNVSPAIGNIYAGICKDR